MNVNILGGPALSLSTDEPSPIQFDFISVSETIMVLH